MNDSAPQPQQDSDASAPRPAWRFSGRRGTPVHLREQAQAALPKEIIETVTQLARERSGERAPAAGTMFPSAVPVANIPDSLRAAATGERTNPFPPVAGAPMPVERRTGGARASQPTSSPTPGAAAPSKGSKKSKKQRRSKGAATPKLAAQSSPSTQSETQPDAAPAPKVVSEAAKQRAEADRKKRAKQQAKAKARAAAKQAKPKSPTSRLFARGRNVIQDTPAPVAAPVIEPVAEVTVAAVQPESATPAPAFTYEPSDAVETPAPEVVAELEISARVEEVLAAPLPLPVAEDDAPPAPELELESESEPEPELAFPTSNPTAAPTAAPAPAQDDATDEPDFQIPAAVAPASMPDSVGGLEAAQQAVFDLGKLPILVDAVSAAASEFDAELDAQLPDNLFQPTETAHPAWEAVAEPAPAEPTPAAIEQLDEPLFAPRERAREVRPQAGPPSEVRRRIEERRAELGRLMDEISSLGS